jgi:hypothetical protein
MKGRKITRAEFLKNYINVDEAEINKPEVVKPEEVRMIFNPIKLEFHKFLGETEKAFFLQFEDGTEHWLSKSLTRVNLKKKHVIMPKNFAQERNLLEFKVDDA